ncbi:MAG: GNAT family N-acetyltransferase, partial [Nocardioidaceae bacterium]
MQLHAGALLLRPWREDDADAYWAALESPGGRLGHGSTLEGRDDLVAMVARRRDWTTGDHASWALTDGVALVGSISIHRIDRE